MSEKSGVHLGSAAVGFGVILLLVGVVYALTAARLQAASAAYDGDEAAVLQRIGPVGKVVLTGGESQAPAAEAEVAAAAAPVQGEAIYNKACAACHNVGVAGAPKPNDEAAWAPRMAQGLDGLLDSAIKGKGAMPPRGTCADCSDDELKAAIEFMVGSAEAAPAAAPAAAAAPAPAPAEAPAAAPAAAEVDLAHGEAIYNQSCLACHAVGVAGAPKLGDQAAWKPRIAQGMDSMLATAIKGRGAMPPKGTCMTCSDEDMKAVVAYMVSKAQ